MKCKGGIKEEYVGEGDRAITRCKYSFPKVFVSGRFTHSGYDLYLVPNSRNYQKFLFNDEFAASGSKTKRSAHAATLAEARKKAKQLL
jgi:hypothetical protein